MATRACYSDSSFCPSTQVAAVAYAIDLPNAPQLQESFALPAGWASSIDDGELYALALSVLAAVEQPHVKRGDLIIAHTDSRNAIAAFQQALGTSELTHLVCKAWQAAEDSGVHLAFLWLRGHAKTQDHRSRINRWCDTAARKSMRSQRQAVA